MVLAYHAQSLLNRRASRYGLVAIFVSTLCLIYLVNHTRFFTGPKSEAPPPAPHKFDGGGGRSKYFEWETTSSFYPVRQDIEGVSNEDLCRSFPHDRLKHEVQAVLKMGSTENQTVIDANFLSVSLCVEDLLVFSDRPDFIHGRQVIDALADLPDSVTYNSGGLYNYTLIRDGWTPEIFEQYPHMLAELGLREPPILQGWNLDKYKFLPMIEKTWKLRPHKKWYLFYESDTYISWDNMFRFIDNLDPDTPLYIGSATTQGVDPPFNNGGHGYLISRAAMEKMMQRKVGEDGDYVQHSLARRWREVVEWQTCGDCVMAYVMNDIKVPVSNFFPSWGHPSLNVIAFSEEFWCTPLLTNHKSKPQDMMDLFRWEFAHRENHSPLKYADIFDFHHAKTPETAKLDNYDNCCWDTWDIPDYTPTFEKCEEFCTMNPECLQYRWQNGTCVLGRTPRQGNVRFPPLPKVAGGVEDDSPETWEEYEQCRYKSGWLLDRLDAWKKARRVCHQDEWLRPTMERLL